MKSIFTLLTAFVLTATLTSCGGNKQADQEAEVKEGKEEVTLSAKEGKPVPVLLDKSSIVWTGNKVGGSHTGTLALKEATLKVSDGNPVGGSFTMDMTSIEPTDLTGEEKEKLMGHLKSPDFFAVKKYPTAEFEITEVKLLEDVENYTHEITGNLTMRGKTNAITFKATVNSATEQKPMHAFANFSINRMKWDVSWNKGIEGMADFTVHDQIGLTIDLFADPKGTAAGDATASAK
jgi:polyisoprenoid-binding protein YceI